MTSRRILPDRLGTGIARQCGPAGYRDRAMMLRHSFEPIDNARLAHLCGTLDEHLRTIEVALEVRIVRRGASFAVEGATAPARRS